MKRQILKKLLLATALTATPLLFMPTEAYAQVHQITLNLAGPDDEPGTPGFPKAPVSVPTLWQDDYLLDFQGFHPDYTLRIVDPSNMVVYNTYVPSSVSQIWLPTILSGTYRIEVIQNDLCFYGDITL